LEASRPASWYNRAAVKPDAEPQAARLTLEMAMSSGIFLSDQQPPPSGDEAPPGYRSVEAKRQHALWVGASAGVLVLLQMILPSIVSLAMMPSLMFGGFSLELPRMDRGASWRGRYWFPVETLQTGGMQTAFVKHLDLKASDPTATEAKVGVSMSMPWLVPADDRLWFVSPGEVGFLEPPREHVLVVKPRKTLAFACPPFLWNNRPAVIEESPAGYRLWSFTDGDWTDHGDVSAWLGQSGTFAQPASTVTTPNTARRRTTRTGPGATAAGIGSGGPLRVVVLRDRTMLFRRMGSVIYVREAPRLEELAGLTPPDAVWSTVHEVSESWTAIAVGDAPLVVTTSTPMPQSLLLGFELRDGAWRETFRLPTAFASEVGAWAEGDRVFLGWMSLPGQFTISEVQGGRVVRTHRGGRFSIFSPHMIFSMWVLPAISVVVLMVVELWIVSWAMTQFRQTEFRSGHATATLALPWRRGIARAIDSTISDLPVLGGIAYAWLNFNLEQLFAEPMAIVAPLLGWVFGALAVWLLTFVAFSVTQGRWGWTPGKWLLGIRVVNLDLKPCGIGWSFLRNLLYFVDQFFNCLVGLLLIAFTDKWQRLGDMVSKTIVIRAPVPSSAAPPATR
jgi:uncharacterized RDD family membrane protein YckC